MVPSAPLPSAFHVAGGCVRRSLCFCCWSFASDKVNCGEERSFTKLSLQPRGSATLRGGDGAGGWTSALCKGLSGCPRRQKHRHVLCQKLGLKGVRVQPPDFSPLDFIWKQDCRIVALRGVLRGDGSLLGHPKLRILLQVSSDSPPCLTFSSRRVGGTWSNTGLRYHR